MKKIYSLLLLLIAFSGCKTITWIAPHYTSVDKIVKLKANMTIAEVSTVLGVQPYDIFHLSGKGSTVFVFNYRIKSREVDMQFGLNELSRNEASQTDGLVKYDNPAKAYLYFEEGKLKTVLTNSGIADSENLIITDNNIQFISLNEVNDYTKFELTKAAEKPQDSLENDVVIIPLSKAGIINMDNTSSIRQKRKGKNMSSSSTYATPNLDNSLNKSATTTPVKETVVVEKKKSNAGRIIAGIYLTILVIGVIVGLATLASSNN